MLPFNMQLADTHIFDLNWSQRSFALQTGLIRVFDSGRYNAEPSDWAQHERATPFGDAERTVSKVCARST
jgi:hypothetical protein